MVGTSKILTVSYGTFSCTLEGFDESFDTMKAIAEYFRDLAADDRYFGAEPPTPDAEMLARIAEREVSRRVEAHEEQGKIVLRASTDTAAPALMAAAADATVHKANEAEADADAAPEVEVTTDIDTPAKPKLEDVTAQDTQAEAATADDALAEEITDDEPAVALDAISDDPAPADPEAEPEAVSDDDIDAALAALDDLDDIDTADQDTAAEAEITQAAEIEDVAPDADEERDSGDIADRLARIRSVVDQTDDLADEGYNEDEHAVDPVAAARAQIEAEMAAATEPKIGAAPAVQAAGIASTLDDDVLSQLLSDAGTDDTVSQPEDATDPEVTADADTAQEAADAAAAETTTETPTETTPEAAPLAARVVKMKRADFEAAIAEGHLEEEDDADDWDMFEADTSADDTALSPEAEAELQRDLAAVEAELDDSLADILSDHDTQSDIVSESLRPTDHEDAVELDPALAKDPEQTDEFTDTFEEDESQDDAKAEKSQDFGGAILNDASENSDVERIFERADEHLGTPESTERRNAIAHLRAAVAASKAEKKAGGDIHRDVDDSPYRADLEDVVRPRRPQTEARTARPERPAAEAKPAPLKLVAEQRVDVPSEPVRPRRISSSLLEQSTAGAKVDTDGGFADFVESVGAHGLSEKLEAAASYMSFVEGQDVFTRPALMRKLREASAENFDREDGLRSFGQLLRDGKLQKVGGGKFTVSDKIEFQPGERRAG